MTILGIDTSTPATAACVLRDDGESFEIVPEVAALTGPPGHARELMPAVTRCLSRAQVSLDDLDAIGVGVGPGTYTGLRIGVVTARALARGAGLELRPVSSLAALAAGIEADLRLPVIDARRGEVFAALYRGGEEVVAPLVATPEALAARLARLAETPLAAGDGSIRFRRELEAAGAKVAADDSPAHVVRALNVCRLATTAPAAPVEAVVPTYLRAPDAQPTN